MKTEIIKPAFLMVPMIVHEQCTQNESMVYATIYWYHSLKDGKCTAGNDTIGLVARVKRVDNALTKLEKLGFIKRVFLDSKKRIRKQIIPLVDYRVSSTEDMVSSTEGTEVSSTEEQNKNNLNKNNKDISPKIPFEEFWNAYDKKTGRPKSEKKWNALSLKDQEAILEYIPKYKIAQPNKIYRKNPETFFNNRSWEDELIADTSANKGMWKCEYGHMHKKGEECGHALERRYSSSPYSAQLKEKFQVKKI